MLLRGAARTPSDNLAASTARLGVIARFRKRVDASRAASPASRRTQRNTSLRFIRTWGTACAFRRDYPGATNRKFGRVFEEASEQTLERDTPARIAAGVLQTLPELPPKPTTAHCGPVGRASQRSVPAGQGRNVARRGIFRTGGGACAGGRCRSGQSLIMLARSGRMPGPQVYERAGAKRRSALSGRSSQCGSVDVARQRRDVGASGARRRRRSLSTRSKSIPASPPVITITRGFWW
jgi:hypothetical protein